MFSAETFFKEICWVSRIQMAMNLKSVGVSADEFESCRLCYVGYMLYRFVHNVSSSSFKRLDYGFFFLGVCLCIVVWKPLKFTEFDVTVMRLSFIILKFINKKFSQVNFI